MELDEIEEIFEDGKDDYLGFLEEFISIPSISAEEDHAADCESCAEWLADRLQEFGLESELIETSGKPVVIGRFVGDAVNAIRGVNASERIYCAVSFSAADEQSVRVRPEQYLVFPALFLAHIRERDVFLLVFGYPFSWILSLFIWLVVCLLQSIFNKKN